MYSFKIATPEEDKMDPIIRCINTNGLPKIFPPINWTPRKYPRNVEINIRNVISGFVSSQYV
jgi:hypothetical protein